MPKPQTWTVLYRTPALRPADVPLAFTCRATNCDDAEETCALAIPFAVVVWAEPCGEKQCYKRYWNA